jgi:transcriptional regulator with XRE-family HTH domain
MSIGMMDPGTEGSISGERQGTIFLVKSLGARLTELLKERGLTATELATRIGVAQGTVSRWTRDERPNISARDLFAMADELNVNPRWLFDGSSARDPQSVEGARARVDHEFASFVWPPEVSEQAKLGALMKVTAEREALRSTLVAYWHGRLMTLVAEELRGRP